MVQEMDRPGVKVYSKGRWKLRQRCVSCKRWLADYVVMYSDGLCPCCGYKGPNAVTIVATTEESIRWITTSPWWRFWNKTGFWEVREKDA